MTNLYEHIRGLAASHERPALVECDKEGAIVRTLSYAELLTRMESAAAGLAARVQKGERVAFAFNNPTDQLIATWAAWASGVVVVPLDTKRDTKELEEFKCAASKATLVLTELPAGSAPVTWMPDLTHEALVLFTSGTTAHPKGAQLTLKNLVVNAEGIKQWLSVTEDDRFMVVLPLHHINSTTFCLTTLLAGGIIVVPPGYSNAGFWKQAAKTGATYTSVVQSIVFDQLNRIAEHAAVAHDLKLSRIQIGSAPVVATAAKEFIDTFGVPLYQGYGQTETALRVTGVPMDLAPELYKRIVADNSIGVPMRWATVEVMDAEGHLMQEGEEGELVVKGPAVMQGYVGGEEAFKDGWFLTGDIGFWKNIEGQRFFYLKGRSKEIIIKGGVNISPVAVENALARVSADIDQAYVVGVPDTRYGEEVGAVVCWKGERRMRQLKAQLVFGTEHVSPYEAPAYLASMSAATLPMTSTGKVQRTLLKGQIREWEPVTALFKTDTHSFEVVRAFSAHADASHVLYNHCWQPLTMGREAYMAFLQKNITLAAIDAQRNIAGQIAFRREGTTLICVSICSAKYVPKPVPEVSVVPSVEEVRAYAPNDPVIKFHLGLGAALVEVLQDARPEDTSALGYQVRMRYTVPECPAIDTSAPVSHQLIQAVLLFACDVGQNTVDALSRPGGLAAYLAVH